MIPFVVSRFFEEWNFNAGQSVNYNEGVKAAMNGLSNDLGCIQFIEVEEKDLASSKFENGLVFVPGNACVSMVGLAPGKSPGMSLQQAKMPSNILKWQGITLSNNCAGTSMATIQHEVLHALGVMHEHSRPDRDTYLNFNAGNTQSQSSYTKIPSDEWVQSGIASEFEVESVMTYCSFCSAIVKSVPVLSLKDGRTFGSGTRVTTSDALQLQWNYCKPRGFEYKPYKECLSTDLLGFKRKVFTDRLCDGVKDCRDGEDETGEGAEWNCIPTGKTDKGSQN